MTEGNEKEDYNRNNMRAKKGPDQSEQVLADEIRENQGIENKLSRYSSAKEHTQRVAEHIVLHEPALHKYTKALSECGSWLVFRNYHTIEKHRLIKANFCKKHLLCGLCAMRRSALQVKAFEPKLNQVLSESPSLVPVLITFTVKNGEDFEERFNHLDKAKKQLVKRRSNALNGRKTDTVLKYIAGASGSYEFKRGSGSGGWHPHIHVVALLEPEFEFTTIERKGRKVEVPLDFENRLRTEWFEQTGDSHMVDVRKIQMDNEEDKFGAICESFKYALKLNELKIEDQVLAAKFLQGRRLQFAFGNLFGVKINESLLDTIESELELLPYIDMVYHHNNGQYHLNEITDYGSLTEEKNRKEEYRRAKEKSFINQSESKWKEDVEEFLRNKEASNDSISINEQTRRPADPVGNMVEGRSKCFTSTDGNSSVQYPKPET